MKMAYIATEPKTMRVYAICSAEPDFLADAACEIKKWKKDSAIIELLPVDEAKARFCEGIPGQSTAQLPLF